MSRIGITALSLLSALPLLAATPETTVPGGTGNESISAPGAEENIRTGEETDGQPMETETAAFDAGTEVGAPYHYIGADGQLRCQQDGLSLRCDFHPKAQADGSALHADLNGEPLPEPSFMPMDNLGTPAHVLIMVDTSDPRRQPIVDQHIEQIKQMTRQVDPQLAIGVGGFDHGLNLISAPAVNNDIAAAADQLHAGGKITELYRSLLQGIDWLAGIEASRRAIFVFSDGLAEDTAYTLPETVQRAHDTGVVLYAIGYTRSASAAISLQTLRRLAEETGGEFYENTRQNKLPDHFPDDPFASLLTGGIYTWDMRPASEQPGPARSEVRISLVPGTDDTTESALLTLPVNLPRPVEIIDEIPLPSPPPPTRVIVETPQETKGSNKHVLVLLFLSVGLLLLILVLISREVLKKDKLPPPSPSADRETPESPDILYGYLIRKEPEEHVYKIIRMPWRIGRSKSNDMVLDDPSISRHHAEITYKGGGNFELQDLGSSNGSFVNDRKIDTSPIRSDDIVELGDIKLLFTLADPDESDDGKTVFLATRLSQQG